MYGSAPALVTLSLPPSRRGRGLGLMSVGLGAGLVLGPLVGGVLVAAWGWRAAFVFRAPVMAAVAVLALPACPAGGAGDRDGPPRGGARDPALAGPARARARARGHERPVLRVAARAVLPHVDPWPRAPGRRRDLHGHGARHRARVAGGRARHRSRRGEAARPRGAGPRDGGTPRALVGHASIRRSSLVALASRSSASGRRVPGAEPGRPDGGVPAARARAPRAGSDSSDARSAAPPGPSWPARCLARGWRARARSPRCAPRSLRPRCVAGIALRAGARCSALPRARRRRAMMRSYGRPRSDRRALWSSAATLRARPASLAGLTVGIARQLEAQRARPARARGAARSVERAGARDVRSWTKPGASIGAVAGRARRDRRASAGSSSPPQPTEGPARRGVSTTRRSWRDGGVASVVLGTHEFLPLGRAEARLAGLARSAHRDRAAPDRRHRARRGGGEGGRSGGRRRRRARWPRAAARAAARTGRGVPVHHAPDDLDSFQAWVMERGWGDGLPLIPPTPERVARMLAGAGRLGRRAGRAAAALGSVARPSRSSRSTR